MWRRSGGRYHRSTVARNGATRQKGRVWGGMLMVPNAAAPDTDLIVLSRGTETSADDVVAHLSERRSTLYSSGTGGIRSTLGGSPMDASATVYLLTQVIM